MQEFAIELKHNGLHPNQIEAHEQLKRCYSEGGKSNNQDGWYILFENRLDDGSTLYGGIFGCWRRNFSRTWHQKRAEYKFTKKERAEYKRNLENANKKAREETAKKHEEVKKEAQSKWGKAPEVNCHPYLEEKQVKSYGLKELNGHLLVPVFVENEIYSVQFVDKKGKKRFFPGGKIKGGYFPLGAFKDGKILIAEGYATAATLHEITELYTIVAFNAGNLLSVAQNFRNCYPGSEIILCGDDDFNTDGNPGLTKAREACLAIGGRLAIPNFEKYLRKANETDFNDLFLSYGAEAVKNSIELSKECEIGEPEPWEWLDEESPCPIDYAPDILKNAINEVINRAQCPPSLAALPALNAASTVAQMFVDVERPRGLISPVSLFSLAIAESGERKTTCDHYFMSPIKDFEKRKALDLKPKKEEYKAKFEAWEAEKAGVISSIKKLTKDNQSTENEKQTLKNLEKIKPFPPRIPTIIYEDSTPEGLAWNLYSVWPSGAIISNEAGIVFGGHGMNNEAITRNLSQLNKLWDGDSLRVLRRGSESFTINCARLTMGLSIQPSAIKAFLESNNGISRGIGFFSRFIITNPKSTQGTRLYRELPKEMPQLDAYNEKILQLLNKNPRFNEFGELQIETLRMSTEAQDVWINFYDTIEKELAPHGEMHSVKDVASKTAGNAARIAAIFHFLDKDTYGEISQENMHFGCLWAAWALNNAKRFFEEFSISPEIQAGKKLDKFLISHCKANKCNRVEVKKILQGGPTQTRSRDQLDKALKLLQEKKRANEVKIGKQIFIQVNNKLLED